MLTKSLSAKNQIFRAFGGANYTYIPSFGSSRATDVTLIPGCYIGPELTGMRALQLTNFSRLGS